MAGRHSPLVKQELREVWYRYYGWEPTYCFEKLASLRVTTTPLPVVLSILDSDLADETHSIRHAQCTEGTFSNDNDSDAMFTSYTVNRSGQLDTALIRADTITITAPMITPYAPYESCTPASRNVLHGDDPNYLPFMPFADDPTFDPTDYVLDHKGLAWQEGYRDSDGMCHLSINYLY